MDEHQLKSVLDMLQEEGLVRLEPQPVEEKYELVHETLTRQMDWLTPEEIELRTLEEIVESTQTLIPLRSEKGGLEDLDRRRDELTLSERHQQLVLRSALEAGHETDYWYRRVQEAQQALEVLTSSYLSKPAQERACGYLGSLGAKEGEFGEKAKEKLKEWACAGESPRISRAACLALAPLVDETYVKQQFDAGNGDLKPGEVGALAVMHDAHGLPLKGVTRTARWQIYRTILENNSIEMLSSILRAASLGALGFGLAGVWNYAQVYRDRPSLPPLTLLLLELSLMGLLVFILAMPGALCAPLGRDLCTLLSGGRRRLPAALGIVAGSALGIGLAVVLVAALAEYRNPDLVRLGKYFISAALWGAAIGLPWLLRARFKLQPAWVILLAGVCGGVVYWGLSQWAWWPETSQILTLDGRYGWGVRIVPGILVGFGNAIGLAWGRLPEQP
jgi:hypothetical protein